MVVRLLGVVDLCLCEADEVLPEGTGILHRVLLNLCGQGHAIDTQDSNSWLDIRMRRMPHARATN